MHTGTANYVYINVPSIERDVGMNKVIQGKRYDTDKAERVGKWEST